MKELETMLFKKIDS